MPTTFRGVRTTSLILIIPKDTSIQLESQAIRQKQFDFCFCPILLLMVALNTNGAFVFRWCARVQVVCPCSGGVPVFRWCACVKRLRKCLAIKDLGGAGRAQGASRWYSTSYTSKEVCLRSCSAFVFKWCVCVQKNPLSLSGGFSEKMFFRLWIYRLQSLRLI